MLATAKRASNSLGLHKKMSCFEQDLCGENWAWEAVSTATVITYTARRYNQEILTFSGTLIALTKDGGVNR